VETHAEKEGSCSQSMDQRGSPATQSPFEKEDTCGGGREGDETNRGGGSAKGEDNRHWSWSSPLRTLALQATCNKGGVFPGSPSSSSSTSRATTMKRPLTAMAIALGSLGFTKTPSISIPPPYGYKYQFRKSGMRSQSALKLRRLFAGARFLHGVVSFIAGSRPVADSLNRGARDSDRRIGPTAALPPAAAPRTRRPK
jgi:hypothetical protein